MPSSILKRFTGLVLAATLVPAITLVGASVYLNQRATLVMEQRVQETLNLAINLEHSLIDAHLNQMKDRAVALAANPLVIDGLASGALRQDVLDSSQEALPGADLLVVVDRTGMVAGRAGTIRRGDTVSYGGFITNVLRTGAVSASVTRIPQADLAAEPAGVLGQVHVPVLETEAATDPRVGTTLEDALALVGAAPVKDAAGNILGAVVVSDILNNDFRIVDDVTSRSPVGLPLHATIALDGVRVTTNVPAPVGGRRAVGTLYSDLVMGSLRAGQEYRGRALVGGHVWERTIYVPLTDQTGHVIAGSFVGVPEESFTVLVTRTGTTIWVAVGVAILSLL
ncbi:MAG TPA: cache domain-containing protein, partial [Symbiobacteriaceae bacterium]|nr:cache domain-containing protein [Symbiobacteriaceae bacterium]